MEFTNYKFDLKKGGGEGYKTKKACHRQAFFVGIDWWLIRPEVMFKIENFLFDLIGFEQEVNPGEVFLKPAVEYVGFFIDIAGEESHFKQVFPGHWAGVVTEVKHSFSGEGFSGFRIVYPEHGT